MKKQALQPNHWDDCARYLSCARRARCALSASPGILTKLKYAPDEGDAGVLRPPGWPEMACRTLE
jgi:hypothetical protein